MNEVEIKKTILMIVDAMLGLKDLEITAYTDTHERKWYSLMIGERDYEGVEGELMIWKVEP